MIFKFLIIFILFISNNTYASNLQEKISTNKNKLKKEQKNKQATSKEILKLAIEIKNEEKKFNDIEKNLNLVSNNIFLNKLKLNKSKSKLKQLDKKSINLKKSTKQIEEKIVNSIVEKYSVSLSKKLVNKESIDDIINKEKYSLILDITKDRILKSNLQYFKVQNDKRKNTKKSKELETFIRVQEKQKNKFKLLKQKQELSLKQLKKKHKIYQKTLKHIIQKQYKLTNLLGDLNILQDKKIKKNKIRKLKEKLLAQEIKKKRKRLENKLKKKTKDIVISKKTKNSSNSKDIKMISKEILQEDIDLTVRNIGSSIKGIKVSKYRGIKTIAPLKSYKVVKKFGKYFDPVYKIELFNESVSLKSKVKNAKVYSVLRGKVVYAKTDAGTLGNVVVVKHSNNLHTVYSQLSNIPRTLKVGKWIPKGYVVGRVKDILIFQATKSNRYINPIKLFK